MATIDKDFVSGLRTQVVQARHHLAAIGHMPVQLDRLSVTSALLAGMAIANGYTASSNRAFSDAHRAVEVALGSSALVGSSIDRAMDCLGDLDRNLGRLQTLADQTPANDGDPVTALAATCLTGEGALKYRRLEFEKLSPALRSAVHTLASEMAARINKRDGLSLHHENVPGWYFEHQEAPANDGEQAAHSNTHTELQARAADLENRNRILSETHNNLMAERRLLIDALAASRIVGAGSLMIRQPAYKALSDELQGEIRARSREMHDSSGLANLDTIPIPRADEPADAAPTTTPIDPSPKPPTAKPARGRKGKGA